MHHVNGKKKPATGEQERDFIKLAAVCNYSQVCISKHVVCCLHACRSHLYCPKLRWIAYGLSGLGACFV